MKHILAAVAATMLVSPVGAQQFEREGSRSAASVLAANQLRSDVHQVDPAVPVRADNYHFTVRTGWGPVTASSYDMLLIRLREIAAIQAITQVGKTEAYMTAVAKAATAPLRTAGNLITNPAETIANAPRGVASMLDRVGGSMSPGRRHDDDVMGTVSGGAAAKREIAFTYRVSPYSSNRILQAKVDELAQAAALGGLTVSAASLAIPGGVGLAFSLGRTSEDLAALLRDKTPRELREANRQTLQALAVPPADIERFLANDAYSPGQQTYLVQSLVALRGVRQIDHFVRLSSDAKDEDAAFLYQRIAQMTAGYHRLVKRVTTLGVVGNVPLALTVDNVVLVLAPMDEVLWTPRTAQTAQAVSKVVAPLKP
ncbi:MAG: hypothetical protein ACREBP_06035, partial [Sphingomicrobium sp.]